MNFVLDSSLAMAFVFQDEATSETLGSLDTDLRKAAKVEGVKLLPENI